MTNMVGKRYLLREEFLDKNKDGETTSRELSQIKIMDQAYGRFDNDKQDTLCLIVKGFDSGGAFGLPKILTKNTLDYKYEEIRED